MPNCVPAGGSSHTQFAMPFTTHEGIDQQSAERDGL